jgi:hypothetical protein
MVLTLVRGRGTYDNLLNSTMAGDYFSLIIYSLVADDLSVITFSLLTSDLIVRLLREIKAWVKGRIPYLRSNDVLFVLLMCLLESDLIIITSRMLARDANTSGLLAGNVSLNTSDMWAADSGIILINCRLLTRWKTSLNWVFICDSSLGLRRLEGTFPEMTWPLKWHDILQHFFSFWIQFIRHFGTIWRDIYPLWDASMRMHFGVILGDFLMFLDATASVFVCRKYISLSVWPLNVGSRKL